MALNWGGYVERPFMSSESKRHFVSRRQVQRTGLAESNSDHQYPPRNLSFGAQDESRTGRALYHCAVRGDTEGMLHEFANGARWNWRHPKLDETALHAAAQQGHSEAVRILLEAGAYVHTEDADGNLASHKAAYNGHLEVMRRLFSAAQHLSQFDRASVDWKNHFGYTALHAAAQMNHISVVFLLLDLEANVNIKENAGKTPLHVAAEAGNFEICRLLLSAGADPLIEDKRFKKPHELARDNAHWAVLDLLMDPYGGIKLP
jgi:ankyrin repeat protein